MPLTELVHTLNASQHLATSLTPGTVRGLDAPFVAVRDRVFIYYAGLRLESEFQPIHAPDGGQLHGHAGVLRASGLSSRRRLAADAVFVLPDTDAEFIQLDRLLRTLHVLNYLTRPQRGTLFLRVHPRHILGVPARHGFAFEEILRPCGLVPEQITLEIDSDAAQENAAHFSRALASYRARGYGIAVNQPAHRPPDFALLAALTPDIVKLAPGPAGSPELLRRNVETVHRLGARALVVSHAGAGWQRAISGAGADFLQSVPLAADGGDSLRDAA